MELCLKLMAIIYPNGLNRKRKLFNEIIDKLDCILLIMPFMNFKSSDTCGIVNSCVLKVSALFAVGLRKD